MRNAHFCKNIKKVYIEFSLLQQWLSEQATNPSQLQKIYIRVKQGQISS